MIGNNNNNNNNDNEFYPGLQKRYLSSQQRQSFLVDKQQEQEQQELSITAEKLNGLTFTEFWKDVIGNPVKNGQAYSIFDYELNLASELDRHKRIWIKKSRGLGISEFFLRYICYLALCHNQLYKGKSFYIVCGPREKTAIDLIRRMKKMILPLNILQDTEKTVAEFADVHIEAFPSNHTESMRGGTDVSFIYVDEADYFEPLQQEEVLSVIEGYIAKTNPHIILVSTPYRPGQLFERIENDDKSIYHKILMPYTIGLGKIYTEEEIQEAKKSPSFKREYDLSYGFGVGNVFRPEDIDNCIVDKLEFDESLLPSLPLSIGVDVGYGSSSNFSVTIVTLVDNDVWVTDSHEYSQLDFNESLSKLFDLLGSNKYGWYSTSNNVRFFIDAASPSFIRACCNYIGQRPDFEQDIAYCRTNKIPLYYIMRVIPVPFSQYGLSMLDKVQSYVSSNSLKIPKDCKSLITQMRIAKTNANRNLDKTTTNSLDSIDSLRLAVHGVET
jgi:hypothetical protein